MAGYTLYDHPLSDLPDVEVDYYEEEDVIDVHTGDTKGEAESIANGMNIFRDKNGQVSGFSIIGASYLFSDEVLDALRRRRNNLPTD